jgi:hypothetical protein
MKSRSIAGLSGLAAAACVADGAGEPPDAVVADPVVAAAVSAAGVPLVAGLASVRVDAERAALVAATAGGVTAGASGSGARVSGAGAAAGVATEAGAGLKGTGFSGSRDADGLMGVGSRETGVAAVAGVFVGLADEEEEGLEMGRGALAEGFEPAGTRAGAAADGPCALGALAGRTERDANEDGGESEDDRVPELLAPELGAPELTALELGAAVAAEVLPGIAAPVGAVLLSDAAGVDAEAAALD